MREFVKNLPVHDLRGQPGNAGLPASPSKTFVLRAGAHQCEICAANSQNGRPSVALGASLPADRLGGDAHRRKQMNPEPSLRPYGDAEPERTGSTPHLSDYWAGSFASSVAGAPGFRRHHSFSDLGCLPPARLLSGASLSAGERPRATCPRAGHPGTDFGHRHLRRPRRVRDPGSALVADRRGGGGLDRSPPPARVARSRPLRPIPRSPEWTRRPPTGDSSWPTIGRVERRSCAPRRAKYWAPLPWGSGSRPR